MKRYLLFQFNAGATGTEQKGWFAFTCDFNSIDEALILAMTDVHDYTQIIDRDTKEFAVKYGQDMYLGPGQLGIFLDKSLWPEQYRLWKESQ